MSKNNERSFFERLTGSIHLDDEGEQSVSTHGVSKEPDDGEVEGQLTVDVYQTEEAIWVQALVAGVKPEDLDISITHEMVTLKGHRDDLRNIPQENFFHKELYWGAFSRTIILPQEVEPDEAEASEKYARRE